jgi:predicted ATPase
MAELALDHLSVARSHGESFGELCTASEVCHLMAMALQAGYGPALEIEARLKEALEVSRGQKARLLELRAATGLARLWRDQGRRAEAIHLLAPLYEWFTEGFALPDLIEAGALLPDLGIRSASDPSFQPT